MRRRETWLVSKGVSEHVHVRYFAHFFVLKAFVPPFRNDRSQGPGNGRAPGQGEKQNVSVTQRASQTHININSATLVREGVDFLWRTNSFRRGDTAVYLPPLFRSLVGEYNAMTRIFSRMYFAIYHRFLDRTWGCEISHTQ